ncbi:hypothetical protein K435DRAFT_869562 [Dendrothele bispora CBS 962.96]|uniref:Ribonuclease H1 N-terminal domain-containing protein n=1 Tax=Dendrothele bispora (strain CBS 962.96) TaxID=1314807 RepID=A0A4V4HCZ2_DENBC|nr:hypothetical protein K435DRAFT_869562 [Dendrothele bispora CBS 962.96]
MVPPSSQDGRKFHKIVLRRGDTLLIEVAEESNDEEEAPPLVPSPLLDYSRVMSPTLSAISSMPEPTDEASMTSFTGAGIYISNYQTNIARSPSPAHGQVTEPTTPCVKMSRATSRVPVSPSIQATRNSTPPGTPTRSRAVFSVPGTPARVATGSPVSSPAPATPQKKVMKASLLSPKPSPFVIVPPFVNRPVSVNIPAIISSTPFPLPSMFVAFAHVPDLVELSQSFTPNQRNVYLVIRGTRIGIFPSWAIARQFVHGVSTTEHISFTTTAEAVNYYSRCINKLAGLPEPDIIPRPSQKSQGPPGVQVLIDDSKLEYRGRTMVIVDDANPFAVCADELDDALASLYRAVSPTPFDDMFAACGGLTDEQIESIP